MRYLICLLMLIGCTSEAPKPNPEIWEVKNDCKRLNELLKGSYFTLRVEDSAFYKGPITICTIHDQNEGYANFYGLQAEGAVRGIVDFHNLPLEEDFRKCREENECNKLKFEHQVNCLYDCKEKVGWWD